MKTVLVLLALLSVAPSARAQVANAAARVDSVFVAYTNLTPGCAVAVDRNGRTVLSRAYGMADLEHDVANTPATIMEAGSVSKQFTATAIILLALDGKLSLDDDVRKYVPELPDYGETITIRHLMTHTSGLRDWGSVAGIAGWPRTTRVHTHDHVVDILSRQRGVNFPPGQEYSYSNSGYNLMAVIVDRVSGMSFAEFSRQRIFQPLGMNDTQWRDDHTRIVKNRAVAYSGGRGGVSIDMPFENVHGNGGLLTTVGDLLIWNRHLESGTVFGPRYKELMHTRGVLRNGEQISYASGLMVGTYAGVPEVSHTGSTAGYRAFLARYPEQQLSIALLCNVGSANPGGLGHDVADVYLPPQPAVAQGGGRGGRGGGGGGRGGRGGEAFTLTPAQLAEYAGDYYSPDVEITVKLVIEDGRLFALRRPADRLGFTPQARDRFDVQSFGDVTFYRDAAGRITQFGIRQGRVYDLRFDRVQR